ncbi:DUF2878 domain-containing protein [Marinomonas agarivorans]|nr:DUF2878 domain-containing protein [Marinomonas agarivorans]
MQKLKSQKKRAIINAILFQIVWFICVMASNTLAVFALCLFCVFHHVFIMGKKKEWGFIVAFSLVGICIDSLSQALNVIHFSHAIVLTETIQIVPIWMMCLWVAFASTIAHGLFWLHYRFKLALCTGLFVVPFSYYAGALLSNSTIVSSTWLFLSIVGIAWSVLLPSGIFYMKKLGLHHE